MNRVGYILVVLLSLISTACSDAIKSDEIKKQYGYVSMECDGTYLKVDASDNISSQFYLRKHSFSYYVRAYFPEGGKVLKMLISSGEGFELNKWYSLPTPESENVWESFAMINNDKKAIEGRVRVTQFSQKGNLNFSGEGYCSITGEFDITLEGKTPGNTIEIKNGKFQISESKYWDSRLMEE